MVWCVTFQPKGEYKCSEHKVIGTFDDAIALGKTFKNGKVTIHRIYHQTCCAFYKEFEV